MAFAVSTCIACSDRQPEDPRITVTFPASALGREGDVLRDQVARFESRNPDVRVELRRISDQSDQRHQLYVQWMAARASDPDVLQLDIVWVAEFANAGWLLPVDDDEDDRDFLPAARTAVAWGGHRWGLPWFVDVGMLYYRSDLLPHAPRTLAELEAMARARAATMPYGLVWQGNRYEGLITVFTEYLGAFGGAVLDASGAVVVDAPQAVAALAAMVEELRQGIVPRVALTWDEEKTRYAFQRGDALMMRNWPYAIAAMRNDPASRVADDFAVAPMPPAPGGRASATLGGQVLAINRYSDAAKAARDLIEFLAAPEQMAERARRLAQFPARTAVYGTQLGDALGLPAAAALRLVEAAVPRPITPLYAEISEVLQIQVHRALAGEAEPAVALRKAADRIRAVLARMQP